MRGRSWMRIVVVTTLLRIGAHAGIAHADEPAAAVTTEKREEARMHFRAGVNLLQDPDKPRYEEAYAEFKRAYELAPSALILGNLALCAMKLERDSEAVDAYTRYLNEVADIDPAERAQTERDLVTLKAGLSVVTVESRPDGAVIRDTRVPARGEPITNSYGPLHGPTALGLRRGHHILKARFDDGSEATWEADLTGGESHVFDRPPPKEDPPPLARPPNVVSADDAVRRPIPPSVVIAGITTGVFGLTAIGTGILAVSSRSDYDQANDGRDVARASELRDRTQTFNVISDIALAGAVVAAAATAYFYLTRPTVRGTPVASAAVDRFSIHF